MKFCVNLHTRLLLLHERLCETLDCELDSSLVRETKTNFENATRAFNGPRDFSNIVP